MGIAIKLVPEWSIVRLEDGRIGCKGHSSKGSREHIIVFADGSGRHIPTSEQVEIIKYPAELAREFLSQLKAAEEEPERINVALSDITGQS